MSLVVGSFVEYKVPYFESFFRYFGQVKEVENDSGLVRVRYRGIEYNQPHDEFLGLTYQKISSLKLTDNEANIERLKELGCESIF